jgi:predicted aspartyl protease
MEDNNMKINFQIELQSGHIHVPVMVNGQGPYTFTLDTGASTTTVSKKLADKLGLETFEGRIKKAGGVGGNHVPVKGAKLEKFSLGDEQFTDETVGVIDFDSFLGPVGCATDGVIGYTTLKNYLLTVDYQTSTLILTKRDEIRDEALSWKPFKYADDESHLVLVPVYVNDTGPFDLILDTGSSGNIITPDTAEQLGIARNEGPSIEAVGCSGGDCQGIGGKVRGYGVVVDRLSVGDAEQSDSMVAVIDLNLISPEGKKIDYGIIGFPFLKDYKLLLDYPNQRFAIAS